MPDKNNLQYLRAGNYAESRGVFGLVQLVMGDVEEFLGEEYCCVYEAVIGELLFLRDS